MSDPKATDAARQSDAGAPSLQPNGKRSGRASFDERGNAVWEWELENGDYSRDITTQELKKLDLDALSIADTAQHKQPPGLGGVPSQSVPDGGFNPYDYTPRTCSPPAGAGPLGGKLQAEEPACAPARRPEDMRKLDEWVKLKRRAQQDPDGEDRGPA